MSSGKVEMKKQRVSENRKFIYTTVSSVLLQVLTVLFGLILPRLFIEYYGSQVNGLVSSISKFLMFVSVMDFGVGEVVRTSYYKPLAERNDVELSKIFVSSNRFFKKIAYCLIFYCIALCFFYPCIVVNNFSIAYSITLILIICLSTFAQYYWGMSNYLLLEADQKGYVRGIIFSFTLVLDFAISFILIRSGISVQVVKLFSSLVFLMRPVLVKAYVRRNYTIDEKISYSIDPVKQKWNGLAQHLSTFVMDYTDIAALTLFSTLYNVSIYSVYHMILVGINGLFVSMLSGFKSLLGKKWISDNLEKFSDDYLMIEWIIHSVVTYAFGCAAILILPFVRVYTDGFNDANYVQPLFGLLLSIAFAINMLRTPNSMLIQAVGAYKETQGCFFCCALVNVVTSMFAVGKYGLIGVSIGTIVAMSIQMIWTALFCYLNIIKISVVVFFKQVFSDAIVFCCGVIIIPQILNIQVSGYVSFCFLAIETCLMFLAISLIYNSLIYYQRVKKMVYFYRRLCAGL